MKQRCGLIGLLIVLTVTLLGSGSVQAGDEPPDQPLDPDPIPLSATSEKARRAALSRGVRPKAGVVNDVIDVAASDAADEQDPAVALCASDQYLVVYEQGGEIYGQRLTSQGDLLGSAFQISEDEFTESKPAVACEWAYNRFIVLWEHDFGGTGTDYDIRYRGVYGGHQSSGSQFFTDRADAANANSNERDPEIACNSFDHTCLVVYENDVNGNGDIYGQRLSVSSSGITLQGGALNISGYTADEYNPHVAWGGLDDDFLVVWQYWHNDHWRVVDRYVYDTFQDGDEFEEGAYFLIGVSEYQQDQTVPEAAYNYRAQRYLVVFQYDWSGDGSDIDIYGLRLTPPLGSEGGVLGLAETSDQEMAPQIAYSGGQESLPGMGADQFLVVYYYDTGAGRAFRAQSVKGTHDGTTWDQREGGPVTIRRTFGGINFGLYNADVVGSVNNGNYFAVWAHRVGGFAGDDYDVEGRLIVPYVIYLPFVVKN